MNLSEIHYDMPEMSSSLACDMMNRNGHQCHFQDTRFIESTCKNFSAFMLMLQTTMMASCEISDSCRRAETNDIDENEKFDFIIVGAGVAGPVIARRLADREPWWKVLLIEAGPSEPTMTSFPGFAFNAVNSSLDWNYKTEPTQPHPTACLETNGICTWPRGKMISGTGGLYGMMYVRGHPEIYNRWSQNGNTGWSYDEIEHYFDRAENTEYPGMTSESNFSRTNGDGLLKINYFNYRPPFTKYLLNAAAELGYKTSGLKGNKQTGFMIAPMITEGGQRGTTSRFYLRPIAHKKHLKILKNAYVTKLIKCQWDDSVIGVELIDNKGIKKIIKADKEVILTAGAIGSARILLSSGIGPKNDLEKLGITVWKNLPVGKNLHNHVSVGIKMSINDSYYETITKKSVKEYIADRSGPLASTGLTQVTAFLESNYTTPGVPDIQVFFDGFSSTCPKLGLEKECHNGQVGICPMRREIVARPTTVIVKSKGLLKLRSNNPLEPPLIYPNYFTDEQDLKVLLEGIKKVIQLTKTASMKAWDLRLETPTVPQCSNHYFGSDAYWHCLIRVQTGPENHQSGTCKMGPEFESDSVVDPKLRVIGVSKLRVADASIFPSVPNSNPTAAIVMVAEKASDMIMKTWKGM
ncbi:hypothetical protein HCN44_006366 [Aphidius gifuensis]|uniref:Uncharacterized protein n=1 Tax=Aphidius gifuensis TaxID=684658 RepID=A0A834XWE3_APHGI|nr:glucose dehydrogenase [FAD, quinone]-like isoform X2 [Aphidius gifuensis]KAF7993306.1 hypothetical protein HCN44_006366 [Aphidius gifuensis]